MKNKINKIKIFLCLPKFLQLQHDCGEAAEHKVHKSTLKESDSHLELGLKIACHSPAHHEVRVMHHRHPGSGNKGCKSLDVTAVLCCAGSELPSSCNSPPGGIAPTAWIQVTPALPAWTGTHKLSFTQEHPWERQLVEMGVTPAQHRVCCWMPSMGSTLHAGVYIFLFPLLVCLYLLLQDFGIDITSHLGKGSRLHSLLVIATEK